MADRKRWLIIYASAGEGHRRAAEAVYGYIKDSFKEVEVSIIDALDLSNFLFRHLYRDGYNFLVKRCPFLWKFAYLFSSLKISCFIRFLVNRLNTQRLEKYILGYNPDIVLTTHFLPLEVVAYLKERNLISCLLVVVVTDFSVHPYWVSSSVDKYMVASSISKDKLISKGIDERKIYVSGIPVDLKFSLDLDKNAICKKLNLKANTFTVLITTAGFGFGPIQKLVDILYREVQVLVVCGCAQRLFRKLEAKNYPNVKIFGFVKDMEELMTVSDVIITKAGGLTISEALAKQLPMIFISPIFGQETENMKILMSLDVGLNFKSIYKIKDFILKCKAEPTILSSIKEKISLIRKPYAVKQIADALC